MNSYQEQIIRLMRTAVGRSEGDVALLHEASRLADLHNDTLLGIRARLQLINTAGHSGYPEAALTAFVWCLAKIDADQDLCLKFERRLMQHYPFIVASLSEYPQVSREQVEHGMRDMADRFARGNFGVGGVQRIRATVLLRLGDVDGHRLARQCWIESLHADVRASPAFDNSDFVTFVDVEFALELGEFERAFSLAAPLIDGTQRGTPSTPVTFSRLLVPSLLLDRREQAIVFHQQSFRVVISNPLMLDAAGYHCAYLALTGQFTKAIGAFETAIQWAMVQKRPWERLLFFEAAAVLFDQLERTGDLCLQLRVPESAPFFRADHTYKPSVVQSALLQMACEIVTAYNRRNGNDYMNRRYYVFRDMVTVIQKQEQPL